MNSRFKLFLVSSSMLIVAALLAGTLIGRAAAPGQEEKYKYFQVFTDVLSRIKTEYVSEPDIKNVSLGALNGLVESLDPYGSYLNADQYKQYLKTKETRKGNVGLILSKKYYGMAGVVDVLEGSPADKAGINTNTIIETINGVSTRDMPLAYAELLLSGDPNTQVELGILQLGQGDSKTMKLTRAILKRTAVESRMLNETTGYLKVTTLEYGKAAEIATAVKDLKAKGASKLILDLRNNASGDPVEGVTAANLFLPSGLIAKLKGQKVEEKSFNADPAKALYSGRLTVIVNKGTAGPAEIAASALQENKRADLVGERTYGNAAQRQTILLDDGSALILATAKYYSPKTEKAIQDTGVSPNVVEFEYDRTIDPNREDDDPAPAEPVTEDTLLKKAREVVEKDLVEKAAAPSPQAKRAPHRNPPVAA